MKSTYHAAIVLCGGRSSRMGEDKASLPFGNETMLERVVRIVGEVVDEIVVVAREGQEVEGEFRVVRDSAEALGPLAGLVEGLSAMESERAFLTSCDVPLLRADYVRRLLELSDGFDLAVPHLDGFFMMTSAVYARACLAPAKDLLAADMRRPFFLVDRVNTRSVTDAELRDVDPDLASFRNCNTPEDYARALADAGFPVPD